MSPNPYFISSEKEIKLAIGISIGSGVLITIVVIVGIWERIQQEKRRLVNARYERHALKKTDVNFLQVQLDLRKQNQLENSLLFYSQPLTRKKS